MIDILTSICNSIYKTEEWPTTWTQSLIITLPKKGNLQLCQNYRISSLISHPKQTPATSKRSHCRREGWFQSGKEYHRTNIQSQDPLRDIQWKRRFICPKTRFRFVSVSFSFRLRCVSFLPFLRTFLTKNAF